jgi:hypothetical protein
VKTDRVFADLFLDGSFGSGRRFGFLHRQPRRTLRGRCAGFRRQRLDVVFERLLVVLFEDFPGLHRRVRGCDLERVPISLGARRLELQE